MGHDSACLGSLFIFSKQDHLKENCRRDVPQRFIICGKMVKPPDNHPCSSCLRPLHIPLVRLIIRMSTASTAVAGACIGPFTFLKNLETVSSLVQTPNIRTNLCHLLHCLWVNHLILIDVCFVAHSAFPSINDETCFFAMYTNLVLMITWVWDGETGFATRPTWINQFTRDLLQRSYSRSVEHALKLKQSQQNVLLCAICIFYWNPQCVHFTCEVPQDILKCIIFARAV